MAQRHLVQLLPVPVVWHTGEVAYVIGLAECWMMLNEALHTCDAQVTKKSFKFAEKYSLPFFFVSASDGTNVVRIFHKAILEGGLTAACSSLVHLSWLSEAEMALQSA